MKKLFYILLLAVIVFQFSFLGLEYFEVIDDNNQLGCYNIVNDNVTENIIKTNKAYNVRPLAFITDAYIFQYFWDNLYVLLVIILMIHVLNVFLIDKICEKLDIRLNVFCLMFFALSPILMEGLYWISASTRIVISTFLSLASIYLLLKSFDEEGKGKKIFYIISSVILNLACVGFYEQTVALNLFLFSFVLICLKKYKYLWIPGVSTAWIGAWYIYFMANGQMQARGALNLSGIFGTAIELAKMVFVYYKNEYYNFLYSIGFGEDVLLGTALSLALLALIGAFIYYIYKNNSSKGENKSIIKKILLGAIIFVSPFLPFLVLKDGMLALRNLYMPTLGLAILIGVLLDLILKLIKDEKICNIIETALVSCVLISFVTVNIACVDNYRKVKRIDDKVVKQIVANLDDEVFEKYKTISVNYNPDALFKYKNLSNYVQSTVESGWAVMGKIQVYRDDMDVGLVYINSMQDEADFVLYFDGEMDLDYVAEKSSD